MLPPAVPLQGALQRREERLRMRRALVRADTRQGSLDGTLTTGAVVAASNAVPA
jgi:hypothetical protein